MAAPREIKRRLERRLRASVCSVAAHPLHCFAAPVNRPPMDIIYLTDLRVETIVGINEWERRVPQTVVMDIEMGGDARKAAASDSIKDTIDYKAVTKRIVAFVGQSRFDLVETLAERVAEILLGEFNVPWCRLRINKQGAVRGVRDVGVVIERGRRS
jgi:dihydroneopterin aldolase